MKKEANRQRWMNLGLGLLAGCLFAYAWPHEPALAVVADRDENFSLMTCDVSIANPLQAVFITDFATGSLKGAILNRQAGKFHIFYYADLATDFQVDPSAEAHYAVVNGPVNMSGQGGAATGEQCHLRRRTIIGQDHCLRFCVSGRPGDHRTPPSIDPDGCIS